MKVTSEKMINRANDLLSKYNQKILVVRWTGEEIEFNNKIVIKNVARGRFIKRIFNKKTDLWIKNHDELIIDPNKENEIKSTLAGIGGSNCQKLYGNSIKNNLNTGIPWNKETKGKYPYAYPCSDSAKKLISAANSGNKNGRFGYSYTDSEKKDKSVVMQKKILDGTFTPNSNNKNTHWESSFNGRKYRSSWEALYQSFNSNAEYEKLRITYKINDVDKIYIVDFIDYTTNLVIEVKPSSFCSKPENLAKFKALEEWAKINGFNFLLITEKWFLSKDKNLIPFENFDEKTVLKIKKLYEISKKNRDRKAVCGI